MRLFLAVMILVCGCIPSLAQQQKTSWFGASIGDVDKDDAEKLGLTPPRGAKIESLVAGGPAEKAGVKRGDVVLSIDGAKMEDRDSFFDVLAAAAPGTSIALSIRRADEEKQISVTLGERELPQNNEPQLILDTGGHMAYVVDLAVTPDGKQLVSASNDKTVRVWDLATGRTVRTIRGEAGPGDWGAIYAMALSPDGRWLAVGGMMSNVSRQSASAIRLYDFASGKLERVLKSHKNTVLALAFSPDSAQLISGSTDKDAIIWDVASGKERSWLKGHTGSVNAVTFSLDGARIATGSDDQTLRLWNSADGKLIAEMTKHKTIRAEEKAAKPDNKDKESKPDPWRGAIRTVAFAPDGRLIASGSEDGRVFLWDAMTGEFKTQLAFTGGFPGFSKIEGVSFSPDGKRLMFSSVSEGCNIYDIESGKELLNGTLHDRPGSVWSNDIQRIRCTGPIIYSPDGRTVFTSYNSSVLLIDPNTGWEVNTFKSVGSPVYAVGFAGDDRSIAWGNSITRTSDGQKQLTRRFDLPRDGIPLVGPEELRFEMPRPPLPARRDERYVFLPGWQEDPSATEEQLRYDRASKKNNSAFGIWSIRFKSAGAMLVDVSVLEIVKEDEVQSSITLGDKSGADGNSPMTFTPDVQSVLVGVAQNVAMYDKSGRHIGMFIGHGGQVRDLVPSPDGRLLLSGSSDQTVRLWNLQTRELIVSLFEGSDGEWVMWTPQGYYASSPNGDKIVGWQINKGPDQAAEYVTASQLRHKFYRPDIVERAIALASATKALEHTDPAQQADFKIPDLATNLPPKLSLVTPVDRTETSNGRANVTLALAETSGDPVNAFEVFVNDIKVTAATKRQGSDISFDVPLIRGINAIRLVARSKSDLLGESKFEIFQNGEGVLDKRNTMFILAVGTDKYPQLPKSCGSQGNASCDLVFAGADAKAFAETIEKQMGKQHQRVVKRVLFNGGGGKLEPTRQNVEDAFDELLQAKENDTVAVFIAGHGVNNTRAGYQFLPSDARYADKENLASSSVVNWTVIESAIQSAKGRRLLFVDTCRSGNAFNARLMKDASDDAIVAYSATNMQQDALELPSLGHGAFTSAVVKGLNGAADIAQEKEVRVFDLGTYLEREVRKLTHGAQTPDFYKKPGAENFVLVRLSNEMAALQPAKFDSDAQDGPPARDAGREQPAPAAPAPQTLSQESLAKAPPPAQKSAPPATTATLPPAAQTASPDVPAKPVPAPQTAAVETPAKTLPVIQPAPPVVQAAKPSAPSISPEEETERLQIGENAFAANDIAAARLIFEFLANRGSAKGAYRLAQTFDPEILKHTSLGARLKPDEKVAARWYARAAELGHPEAQKKVAGK